MASVAFIDETLPGARTAAGTADFATSEVTARELIARRVVQDVVAINANRMLGATHSLVVPTSLEHQLNGTAGRKGPSEFLDESAMRQAAYDAFSRNGFFLIVGDRQLTSLDESATIALETEVVFIKLVPLVGG